MKCETFAEPLNWPRLFHEYWEILSCLARVQSEIREISEQETKERKMRFFSVNGLELSWPLGEFRFGFVRLLKKKPSCLKLAVILN